jgi:AcrR family transcriptional regulator
MKKLEGQREIIYNTAKDIIMNKNIDHFSIRMISKKCNIGIGTIYNYYGNKEAILLDITKELWLSYIEEITKNGDGFDSFIDWVKYIYNRLEFYSQKFNYVILSRELTSGFYLEGKSSHTESQEILVRIIAEKLSDYYKYNEVTLESYSNFIANNLKALISQESYDVESFFYVLNILLNEKGIN